MKVLEEFWYGSINPMRPYQSQRKFDKVFRLLLKKKSLRNPRSLWWRA